MNAAVAAVRQKLIEGSGCATILGLFLVQEYPAYDGKNPRTGQSVYVPAKRLPFLLVSDALSSRVLGDRFSPEAEERERLAKDGFEIPEVLENIDCTSVFDDVARSLGIGNRATVDGLGEFVIRALRDSEQRLITFSPAPELKSALNDANTPSATHPYSDK